MSSHVCVGLWLNKTELWERKMKIVLNSKFFSKLSIEQLGEKAAGFGYDGIDICIRSGHPIHVENAIEALPKAVKHWQSQNLICPLGHTQKLIHIFR